MGGERAVNAGDGGAELGFGVGCEGVCAAAAVAGGDERAVGGEAGEGGADDTVGEAEAMQEAEEVGNGEGSAAGHDRVAVKGDDEGAGAQAGAGAEGGDRVVEFGPGRVVQRPPETGMRAPVT